MATLRWVGKNQNQAQVNTITPANVGIGNTFTVTENGKNITYTAAAATVADVTAGLVALLAASTEGEFTEKTWTDNTTNITGTAKTPGRPFTQTSSASGGTATLTTATTTANISANDWNAAGNYDTGSLPVATNDLVLDAGNKDVLYNVGSLSAVTLASLTRRAGYTGRMGLDEYDPAGNYFQYRPTEIAISATTMLIEQPTTDPIAGLKFNVAAAQCTLTVLGQGGGQLGSEQLWWRGTHVSNVVNVTNGNVAIAPIAEQLSTIATINAERSTVRCGSGCTLTTINSLDSTVEVNSNVTTLTQKGLSANSTVKGAAAVTTDNLYGGSQTWQSSGNITTLTLGAGATIDFSQGSGAVTITNAITIGKGATFWDPQGRTTQSAGFTLGAGVLLSDVTINVGPGRTVTIT